MRKSEDAPTKGRGILAQIFADSAQICLEKIRGFSTFPHLFISFRPGCAPLGQSPQVFCGGLQDYHQQLLYNLGLSGENRRGQSTEMLQLLYHIEHNGACLDLSMSVLSSLSPVVVMGSHFQPGT